MTFAQVQTGDRPRGEADAELAPASFKHIWPVFPAAERGLFKGNTCRHAPAISNPAEFTLSQGAVILSAAKDLRLLLGIQIMGKLRRSHRLLSEEPRRQNRDEATNKPSPNCSKNNVKRSRDIIAHHGIEWIVNCATCKFDKPTQRPNDWIKKHRPPVMSLTSETAKIYKKAIKQIDAPHPPRQFGKAACI
jgi:hypothetical protein